LSDTGNNRVRVIATNGIITTFAGSGPHGTVGSYGGDGGPAIVTNCKISEPRGLYGDTLGNIYIADYNNARIRKVNPSGIISTFAGGGTGGDGGQASNALLLAHKAYDMKGDRLGNIYITDGCKIRMVNSVGIINTIAGTGTCSNGGTVLMLVSSATFKEVWSLWINTYEEVYFSETSSFIRKIVNLSPSPIPSAPPTLVPSSMSSVYLQVVAGIGTQGYNNDNQPATLASLFMNDRGGVFVSITGEIFIADYGNCRIRKVNLQRIITTIVGTGGCDASGIGGIGSSTSIHSPTSITGDTMGTFLYFNDDYFIWKYQLSNGIVSRCAGALPANIAFSGDGQQATTAYFKFSMGLSLSRTGLLYSTDYGSNRVRVIAVNGIISTFAGTGITGSGSIGDDGLATSARLNGPNGIYVDSIGNVFIADSSNVRIRKVDSSGIIRTYAGGGTGGDGGPASSALLSSNVWDVKGDRLGNIYFTEMSKIKMVNTDGIIFTIIGTGTSGTTMNLSPVLSSNINVVYGLALDSNSNIYLAERPGIIHKTINCLPTSQPSSQPTRLPSSQPICQPSSYPTCQPTSHPLSIPTSSPSNQPLPSTVPSNTPSNQPSSEPSLMPSSNPSLLPSSTPSNIPTSDPSVFPTGTPSCLPSSHPSCCPSSYPSAVPSTLPSAFPSSVPSSHPTPVPSSTPSCLPTFIPTGRPSLLPSSCPSVSPSVVPSLFPSSIPSSQPVLFPSSFPSSFPTIIPSSQPTKNPSSFPTSVPSLFPSSGSSSLPSSKPSMFPSSIPSTRPSYCPSVFPSSVPSIRSSSLLAAIPSEFPTAFPSSIPSTLPSNRPSVFPSSVPSIRSSSLPTAIPSEFPSGFPSSIPSGLPSIFPSNIPTGKPSATPSVFPTFAPSYLPLANPSYTPSGNPISSSHEPTPVPSMSPTTAPSRVPTLLPTILLSSPLPASPSSSTLSIYPSLYDIHFKGSLFLLGTYLSSPATRNINLNSQNIMSSDETQSYVIFGRSKTESSMGNINLQSKQSSSYYTQLSSSGSNAFLSRDSMSRSSSVVGDINGDDVVDLIIGYPYSSRCVVYLGRNQGNGDGEEGRWTNMIVSFIFRGLYAGDSFGWAIDGLGDINHDGYDDIAIAAKNSGIVYILYGKAQFRDVISMSSLNEDDGYRIVGSKGTVNTGMSISKGGDFNGDGKKEIVISTMISSSSLCVIYVISLSSARRSQDILLDTLPSNNGNSSGVLLRITGPSSFYVGFSLTGVWDLNGDGYDDIVIGSIPYHGDSSNQKTYVIYGNSSYVLNPNHHHLDLSNLQSKDGFIITGGGFLVASPGDVNNDNISDLLIIRFSNWKSSSNAYLLRYPRNVTSSPSFVPSSSPSFAATTFLPSNRPSHLGSYHPTKINATLSPSQVPIVLTRKPSMIPTIIPSIIRTTSPSKKPSLLPSLTPTLVPSVHPTKVPKTTSIPLTFTPISFPSSSPTSSIHTAYQETMISASGNYDFSNSSSFKHVVDFLGIGNYLLSGGNREIVYHFKPIDHQIIEIIDYNSQKQKLDFTAFSSLFSIKDLSYSFNPLTLYPQGRERGTTSTTKEKKEESIKQENNSFLFLQDTNQGSDENVDSSIQKIILSSHKSFQFIDLESFLFHSFATTEEQSTSSTALFDLSVVIAFFYFDLLSLFCWCWYD
jgi:hypothetical protein